MLQQPSVYESVEVSTHDGSMTASCSACFAVCNPATSSNVTPAVFSNTSPMTNCRNRSSSLLTAALAATFPAAAAAGAAAEATAPAAPPCDRDLAAIVCLGMMTVACCWGAEGASGTKRGAARIFLGSGGVLLLLLLRADSS